MDQTFCCISYNSRMNTDFCYRHSKMVFLYNSLFWNIIESIYHNLTHRYHANSLHQLKSIDHLSVKVQEMTIHILHFDTDSWVIKTPSGFLNKDKYRFDFFNLAIGIQDKTVTQTLKSVSTHYIDLKKDCQMILCWLS